MEIKVNINTRAIAMGIVRSLAHSLHHHVTDQAIVRFGNVAGQPLSQFFSFGLGQVMQSMPSMQPPPGMHPMHPPSFMHQRHYGVPGYDGYRFGIDSQTGFATNPRVAEDGIMRQPTEEAGQTPVDDKQLQNAASDPNEPPKNQFTYEQMLDQFCNDPHVIGAVERVLVKQLETYAQLAAQEPTPMPAFRPGFNRTF